MDWYQLAKLGDKRKRREALRDAIKAYVENPANWVDAIKSTRSLLEEIVKTGTQDPVDSAEAAKLLARDAMDIAPYYPQWAERGEPKTVMGRTVRPWTWCLKHVRDRVNSAAKFYEDETSGVNNAPNEEDISKEDWER